MAASQQNTQSAGAQFSRLRVWAPAPRYHGLLRRKQFFYFLEQESSIATRPGLEKRIVRSFKAMAPVIEFLNEIFLASAAGEEEEEPRPKRPAPMF